mmetsp:Transcript_94536/g.185405  ORF Transcript_94536/g.185405 Transcript_94536/m.185405 type:complete len:329 (+) Transcript_94536:76-1062(+)
MQWAFGNAVRGMSGQFESQYNCTSTAMAGKDIDEGDKIFLPPSALDRLARMNVEYPMLFEVTNNQLDKKTHCGVLEFSAEEGWCYMTFGMMQNLCVDEGSLITVKNVSLPKASFVKFRAQSVDFLEVSNPRALLEVSLRKFTCLTVGDTICIPYSDKKFYLDVREVEPNGAASIIETDCNVDFEEPLGYKESKYAQYEKEAQEKEAKRADEAKNGAATSVGGGVVRTVQRARAEPTEAEAAAAAAFKPFSGAAKRIDGKLSTAAQEAKAAGVATASSASTAGGGESKAESKEAASAPVPVYQSRIGDKYSKKKTAVSAFTGTAHKLNP